MITNLHPLLVHFPIALLLAYIVLDWAGRIWKEKGFTEAAWYSLILGTIGALVTLGSGLLDARGITAADPAFTTLTIHKISAIATVVLFGFQTVCYARNRGKYTRNTEILHTIIQLAGATAIIITGYFGGQLVFEFGIGVLTN